MRKSVQLIFAALVLLVSGCYREDYRADQVVVGYVPIYADKSHASISFTDAGAPLINPGKIYLYNNYLLINEMDKGIHVFDNSNPVYPKDLGFIEMIGNQDMAIKDNVLFADHAGDLVALKFNSSNPTSTMNESGRLPINSLKLGLPAPTGSYFECINQEAGYVVGWKKKTLTSPQCYAY